MGVSTRNRGNYQGFPRDRIFVSGRDPAGSRYPGIPRDVMRKGFYSTGRYRTGLNHDRIENLDGIEISRDLTGRKKHGTPRDGIEISRDCTVLLSRSGL